MVLKTMVLKTMALKTMAFKAIEQRVPRCTFSAPL